MAHATTSPPRPFDRALLGAAAPRVAQRLLGAVLLSHSPQGTVSGRIVETEAYDADDPASHSCRGITPRNRPMFGAAGLLYVYRSYGIHLCINVVSGDAGHGAAVLVRALQPLSGLGLMAQRRGLAHGDAAQPWPIGKLCCGPGNLAAALGVVLGQSGDDLLVPWGRLQLLIGDPVPAARRRDGPRVGISCAQDVPWRFVEQDSPWLSRRR